MFTILSISDSDKHFGSAILEYEKRLWKQLKIENIKPFKAENHTLIIQKETELLLEILEKKYWNYQKILLIKEGQFLTTEELSEKIEGKDSVFIIGWPYGVDEKKMKSRIPKLNFLSFWAITLPHGLAKLALVEQLYRATTLWSWKKYHY